uniref:Uncharacterized protein n=1 Tax=Rhizophora mucronata TaxID=61149 RepID=A0A2P2P069_RHIMU
MVIGYLYSISECLKFVIFSTSLSTNEFLVRFSIQVFVLFLKKNTMYS